MTTTVIPDLPTFAECNGLSPLTGAFVSRSTHAKHNRIVRNNAMRVAALAALRTLRANGSDIPETVWTSITETIHDLEGWVG